MDRKLKEQLRQDWENHLKSITDNIVLAAREEKIINISYKDKKGSVSNRNVEPYEVKNETLYGYCLSKNSIRQFKIENIVQAKITEDKFIPRYPIVIKG